MQQIVTDIVSDATVQHLSAQNIADRTGLDRKTVSSILSGENANPKLETLQAIAECLGGTLSYSTVDSRAAIKAGDISYYRTLISSLASELDHRNRWLKVLFFTSLGLIALIIFTNLVALFIVSSL